MIVVRRFFTWTALGGVDLRFSLMLVRKASAVDRKFDDPRGMTITNAAPRRSTLLCNLLHNNVAGCLQTVQYFCAII
jgi:hypothetical protein